MRRITTKFTKRSLLGGALLGLLGLFLLQPLAAVGEWVISTDLPQFPSSSPDVWLNSKPLQPKDLLGEVVLVEVWTSV